PKRCRGKRLSAVLMTDFNGGPADYILAPGDAFLSSSGNLWVDFLRLQRSGKYTGRIGGTMSTATTSPPIRREPELLGQTVVVIGGSSGIGFETARRARAEGARVILTGRNAERLQHAAGEID